MLLETTLKTPSAFAWLQSAYMALPKGALFISRAPLGRAMGCERAAGGVATTPISLTLGAHRAF